jgi:hypothetical protein
LSDFSDAKDDVDVKACCGGYAWVPAPLPALSRSPCCFCRATKRRLSRSRRGPNSPMRAPTTTIMHGVYTVSAAHAACGGGDGGGWWGEAAKQNRTKLWARQTEGDGATAKLSPKGDKFFLFCQHQIEGETGSRRWGAPVLWVPQMSPR